MVMIFEQGQQIQSGSGVLYTAVETEGNGCRENKKTVGEIKK